MYQAKSECEKSVRERRKGVIPIPLNLREYLNDEQRRTLRQVEGFGWRLAFIRRPLFQEPVIIIKNFDGSRFNVVEPDGSINVEADVIIRH